MAKVGRQPEDFEPTSRGKRVRRWGLWAIVGLIVCVIMAHTIWLAVEGVQLHRALVALAAAGEPATVADLARSPVPAAQNGFDDLAIIGQRLYQSSPADLRWEKLDEVRTPLVKIELQRLTARLADHHNELPLLERVIAKPNFVATRAAQSPVMLQNWPELNFFRSAADLLADEALLAHEQGDDSSAFRRLSQLPTIAKAAESTPIMVGMLMGTGIRAMAVQRISWFASSLRIGNDANSVPATDVCQLIRELLDDTAIDARNILGWRKDRVEQIDRFMNFGTVANANLSKQNNIGLSIANYVFRPLYKSNAVAAIELDSLGIQATHAPNFPAAKATLASMPVPTSGLAWISRGIATSQMVSQIRLAELGYRTMADRRLAAVALAVRCFEVETGHLPRTLSELIPEYLPTIPVDPMAANGALLQCRLNGRDPIVWSVGSDGVDNGGDDSEDVAKYRRPLDQVIHLTVRPRTFGDTTAALNRMDLDAPIRQTVAATQPLPPVTQPSGDGIPPMPNTDEIQDFDVEGDPALFGFANRQAAVEVLAFGNADDPSTPPTTQPAKLWGTLTNKDGVWRFQLSPDGRGRLIKPSGDRVQFRWSVNTPNNENAFWK